MIIFTADYEPFQRGKCYLTNQQDFHVGCFKGYDSSMSMEEFFFLYLAGFPLGFKGFPCFKPQ